MRSAPPRSARRPGGSPSPTGSRACAASPPRPARGPARGRRARARAGAREAGRIIGRLRNPGRDIRRGGADGTGAAAIVAADGHRLAYDGGARHDATQPRAARGGDGRGGGRPAPARLRAVVPQLRRALRARVGARHRDGADAGLHRPLRADAASARDAGLARGGAVRRGRRLDHGVGRPALLRRARLARLPARGGAVLARGRRRDGARGADAAGARARRPARLPGHPVRGPDRVGGAARGAAPAPRRAGARAARRGRADAAGGVGARRALRAVRVARRLEPRARRLRRADRARARCCGR